jgi:hypothetical protein
MKELIRHILREETYSPAGKEIIPNEKVFHQSNPMFRNKIEEQGLKVKDGECYRIYVGYGTKCKPAIFATNSSNKRAWFDSTYDDDVWEIDTTKIPNVKWYKDRHFESRSKHIVTFENIPRDAIKLIYEGSGKGDEYIVEGIKPHPKEEEFKQYQDVIDSIVYGIVNEDDLCGYRTEFFLNAGEDALQIVLYYKKGRYPGYDVFSEKRTEMKNTLETYLPIIEMAFVSYDSTRCKETIKENKDTEIEKNLKVINTLLSLVSWDGLCDIWVEYNPEDEEYEIRSKTTASYFGDNDIEQELESLENTLSSMGIRVYIYTPWYVKNCEDEVEFMNESDESKQERKFNKLIQKIEDYLNTNEYPSVKKFTVYYDDTHDDVIVNIFFNVEDSIRLGGGINSVIKRVGKQVMEDLEVFPMDFKYYIHFDRDINESEEKQPKYLNLIKDIVEPFKYEDCVCDIRVLYNEEDDMYLIDLNMGTEELNNKFIAVIGMTHYVKTLRLQITKSIKDYLPIDNFYVGSYASPNCKWKPLNESDNKEQSLQKLIDQYGLYEFIKMSGLDFNQVKSILNKMDNPKEILKQYIREYVLEYDGMSSENSGVLIGVEIPLSNTKYVNDIMVQDSDQIAVEIFEFGQDEYGHIEQKDQYLTTINILTNEELLSILSWMMEIIQNGYWD